MTVLAVAGCQADTDINPEAAGETSTTERPNTVRDEARVATTAPPGPPGTLPPTTVRQSEGARRGGGGLGGPLGTTYTVGPGDGKITAFAFRASVTPTNSFFRPKGGTQYAAADVQVCAGPAGERFSPNRFDFELALTDNTRVDPGIGVIEPELASSPLLPGDCRRGWITFEVPTSATVRHIVYSSGNHSAKWLLA